MSGCPASPHGKCRRVTYRRLGKTRAQTGWITHPIICHALLATPEKQSLSHLTGWHIWSTDELCCKNKRFDVNGNYTRNKIRQRSAMVCGLTFSWRCPTEQLSWRFFPAMRGEGPSGNNLKSINSSPLKSPGFKRVVWVFCALVMELLNSLTDLAASSLWETTGVKDGNLFQCPFLFFSAWLGEQRHK